MNRVRAENPHLDIIGIAVAIGIGIARIGEREIFFNIGELITVAILVSVHDERTGAFLLFPTVRHPVAVRIGEERIRAGIELVKIGNAVIIVVKPGIRCIGWIKAILIFPPVRHSVAIGVDNAGLMEKIRRGDYFARLTFAGPGQDQAGIAGILEIIYFKLVRTGGQPRLLRISGH